MHSSRHLKTAATSRAAVERRDGCHSLSRRVRASGWDRQPRACLIEPRTAGWNELKDRLQPRRRPHDRLSPLRRNFRPIREDSHDVEKIPADRGKFPVPLFPLRQQAQPTLFRSLHCVSALTISLPSGWPPFLRDGEVLQPYRWPASGAQIAYDRKSQLTASSDRMRWLRALADICNNGAGRNGKAMPEAEKPDGQVPARGASSN
jgi:hypothetical protein